MTIEDHIGVDRVDRKALRPHFLYKETRFYNVAQRVTNTTWGRRRWDCPKLGGLTVVARVHQNKSGQPKLPCVGCLVHSNGTPSLSMNLQ